jgi:hypothetical protein
MSLYNSLFGVNNKAGILLGVLGLRLGQIPRFRDAFLSDGKIAIYTRTGGGNREYYENESACRANYPERFVGDDSPSGPWNQDLREVPGFLYDENDDYDSTYATFYYKFPDEYAEDLKALETSNPDKKPSAKFMEFIHSLETKP